MIQEIKAYRATCDNCGEYYEHWHSGFSIYIDEGSIQEDMDSEGWYTTNADPEHDGKEYCPKCFKWHPEEDDKIILNTERTKQP
jgi:hypothetical protein